MRWNELRYVKLCLAPSNLLYVFPISPYLNMVTFDILIIYNGE